MTEAEIEAYAKQHDMTVEHVKNISKTIAESLNRHFGKPTMADEDFEDIVHKFMEGVKPSTDKVADVRYAWREIKVGLLTIMPLIDKPYPDDPRWTPYTRFLKRYVEVMDTLLPQVLAESYKAGEEEASK